MTFLELIKKDILAHEREIEKLRSFIDAEPPWLLQEAVSKEGAPDAGTLGQS